MYEIAADGVSYAGDPRKKSTVLLVVGGRKDVLVRCPASGQYPLSSSKQESLINGYLGNGTDVYEGTIMTLHVERPAEEGKEGDGEEEALAERGGGEEESGLSVSLSLPPPRPPSHPQFQDLRTREPVDPARRLDYVFTTAGKGKRADGFVYSNFGVNNKTLSVQHVQRRIPLGALEEWRLSESDLGTPSVVNHPFHMHVNHFQIVGMSHGEGVDYAVGDWRDSISLPLLPAGGGFVTIRWRADDYTGKAPAHCHIFAHSDTGMSYTFEIYDPEKEKAGMVAREGEYPGDV
uniref:Multicopper oxidase type 2 n=1 Tax=Nannochloropsis gaditana (strain CCMP526) TaxID=1093141 RepID=I2CR18_NANGC